MKNPSACRRRRAWPAAHECGAIRVYVAYSFQTTEHLDDGHDSHVAHSAQSHKEEEQRDLERVLVRLPEYGTDHDGLDQALHQTLPEKAWILYRPHKVALEKQPEELRV